MIEKFLVDRIASMNRDIMIRGLGMIWGVDLSRIASSETVKRVSKRCFDSLPNFHTCGAWEGDRGKLTGV